MIKVFCDVCGKEMPSGINCTFQDIPELNQLSQRNICSPECRAKDVQGRCAKGDDTCTEPLKQCQCECGNSICSTHVHDSHLMCKACGDAEEERLEKEAVEMAADVRQEMLDSFAIYQKALADLKEREPDLAPAIEARIPIYLEGDEMEPVSPAELIEYYESEEEDKKDGLIRWLLDNGYRGE